MLNQMLECISCFMHLRKNNLQNKWNPVVLIQIPNNPYLALTGRKPFVCAVKFTIQARNRMLIEIALLSQGVFKAFQGMGGLFQIHRIVFLDTIWGNTLGCIMFGPFWSVWCKIALAEVGVSLLWWCLAPVLLGSGSRLLKSYFKSHKFITR